MRRFLVALVAAVLTSAPAPAHDGCHSKRCVERVKRKMHREALARFDRRCSQSRPRACVELAVRRYRLTGWQAAWMRRVPGCESRWSVGAYNPSGASGLFQFMPGTWATTPYGRRSIWSARWQAHAAAWMVLQGRTGEWVCR